MMNKLPKIILLPLFIMVVQVLLFSHIHMAGMAVPFFFIIIIMMMPYDTSPYLLMLTGFSLGLIVDLFMNTIGLNAAATTFLAFIRPSIIRAISRKDYSELCPYPNVHITGFAWFSTYSLLCCFFHEAFLYTVEAFSFANYTQTIIRIITGTLFSAILIIITEYITQKPK
ncbi:MAG: rod shape-determining protein MreD [Mangrovibacterium sp.]